MLTGCTAGASSRINGIPGMAQATGAGVGHTREWSDHYSLHAQSDQGLFQSKRNRSISNLHVAGSDGGLPRSCRPSWHRGRRSKHPNPEARSHAEGGTFRARPPAAAWDAVPQAACARPQRNGSLWARRPASAARRPRPCRLHRIDVHCCLQVSRVANYLGKSLEKGDFPLRCVPSMFDSSRVKVPLTT